MNIILASTSPRRKNILEQEGIAFDVISPEFDETFKDNTFSYDKVLNVSYNKAKSIADKVPKNSIIISADTIVVYDNKILLKPKDKKEAFNILNKLSGREHFVITAYTIFCPERDKVISKYVKSIVSFGKLTKEQIEKYINDFHPLDKAGAYGIQELPDYFNAKTEGSVENIIGLPIKEILEDLKNF